jgi:hypothetical protein
LRLGEIISPSKGALNRALVKSAEKTEKRKKKIPLLLRRGVCAAGSSPSSQPLPAAPCPDRISSRGIQPCALLAPPGSSPLAARRCSPGEPADGRKPLLLLGSASLLSLGARRLGGGLCGLRLEPDEEWISGEKKDKGKGGSAKERQWFVWFTSTGVTKSYGIE